MRGPVRLALASAAFTALATLTGAARACNLCLEDKIAATYDWQVVSMARRQGHTVVFTAIEGAVTPEDARRDGRLIRAISGVRGVDAGSVRLSPQPPAVSFACDLARRSVGAMLARANETLRPPGFRLTLVRVGAPEGQAIHRAATATTRLQ